MKKVANISAYIFILAVVVLSAVSILGVWDFFKGDVILKSFESVGLLAIVSMVVIGADHFANSKSPEVAGQPATAVPMTNEATEIFTAIRKMTLALLIAAAALLALLGILSIWEVLVGSVLHKSLASLAIVGFSSIVIVIMCIEREGNTALKQKHISGWAVFGIIILVWIFMSSFATLFYR